MRLDSTHPRPSRRDGSRQAENDGAATGARERVERLLDEALGRLAAGDALELDDYRGRVAPSEWARFAGTLRAEEYRFRLDQEEDVALEPLLEELDDSGREHFFRTLAVARIARGCLPHRIEPGIEIRGRWLVLRRLGSGGQARVYAAWDKEFELEVALKVFDEPAPVPGEPPGRVALAESRVLAHLRSRNIVRVFDVVREQGLTVVVMGLVRGVSLRDALDRLRAEEASGADPRLRTARLRAAIGAESEGEYADLLREGDWYRAATRIALAMARALAAAHEGDTAHRDLNPKNVMLVGGGEPVLLDFGLAVRRGQQGTRGWTFPYIAPEGLGEREVVNEARADLYQFGLVLYELLTLERAFALREGESRNAVLFRIARGEFTPPRRICPALPEALGAICLHALAADPAARYASAEDLAQDLERFLRGLPPRAAPLRLPARLCMRARHAARNLALLGIAALLAAVTLTAVLAGESWRPPRVHALRERADLESSSGSPAPAEPVTSGQSLLRGDWVLGAEVDCPMLSYLYAFRLSGQDTEAERLFVTPTGCLVAERSHGVVEGTVRLEPGRHTVHCLDLRAAGVRTGLLLVFSPEENAVLEELRRELAAREQRFEPARYGELSGILATLSGSVRGQSVSALDPASLRRLHERARNRRGSTGPRDPWDTLGAREYLFVFTVIEAEEDHTDD